MSSLGTESSRAPLRTLEEQHSNYLHALYVTHERTVMLLLFVQWFACIAIAIWTSPFTINESGTQIHEHVWMALVLGASLTIFPTLIAYMNSGRFAARISLAIAQVLFSSLLIHLMHGRIEAHFHVFGSLALLSFFRDWRVIVAASAVVLIDHGLRGFLWPEMVYGSGVRSFSRTLEHGIWVVFIDIFLILSCMRSQHEMLEISRKNAELLKAKEQLDERVFERTRELQLQKEEVGRLALVAKNTTNAVMILDVDYRVVWVNAGWSRIYGHSSDEAIGTAIAKWLDLSQWKNTRHPSKQEYGTLSQGIRFEAHLASPDGDRTLDTEFQPLWGEPGNLTGFIVIQNDVTEKVTLRDRVTSIFAAIAEGIMVQDSNGHIVDCNPQAKRIFGIQSPSVGTESTITCETVFEDGSNWPHQDHPAMVTLRSGIPIHDAIMGVRDQSGLLRWISVNTKLIQSKSSESHVVSSFTDITLRREQLERMDLTIRGAGLGVWDWNAVTDHVRFNHLFARMLGYGPEQLRPTRQQWLDLIHPEDLLESHRLLELHLNGEKPDYRCEYRMKHASGEWHWVLAAGRIMERGTEQQPVRIAGVHVDINKSKKLETKLRENEARMRQIFDLALDGVVATDKQGQIRDWNLQAERIFGYSRTDAIGQRLDHLLRLEHEHGDFWNEATGQPKRESVEGRRFQTIAVARDGRRLYIEIALSAIHVDEQLAYSLFIRDITQSKMLEQQLMQSQRLESIGQLAAGVAHEINTPVQFVNDSVHFLKDGVHDLFSMIDDITESIQSLQDEPSRDRLMERVSEASRSNDLEYLAANIPQAIDRSLDGLTRVAEIVRSMKEFSHRGTGEMKAHDLTRAILNTLTVAQNEYKYVADVETDCAGIPLVTCNGGEISQVLLNLVVNAAHAIADRVKGSSERGKITIAARADETSVYIDISDTGGGIPKRIQHRIFEPFFTTKEVGRGSGQGLAIAHSVIKNHQGELSFSTTSNVGTTFHIRLPIDQRPVAAEGRA